MILSSLMNELEKDLELNSPIPQDMPGVYTIPLEESVSLSFSSLPGGGIYINGTVGPIPKGQEELMYTEALLANLFCQGTRGAVLGLNENGTLLTLSRSIDYDIEFKEFKDIVEDFINSIDFWREETIKAR